MSNINWSRFLTSFQLICWTVVLTLVVYWIYAFSQNEDLSVVEYRKYYETESDIFPTLTICLKNPIINEKFHKQVSEINQTTYLQFLKGNYFNRHFLNINYENVTINMNEYVTGTWISWRNGSLDFGNHKKVLTRSYVVSRFNRFYNCYTLQVPHNEQIRSFTVFLKASVFTFLNQTPNYDMMAAIHYPNQFLATKNIKHSIPKRHYTDNFKMNFQVDGIEVIRRRNKANRRCFDDWKNYDKGILTKHIQKVGCRAPYHRFDPEIRLCSTKEEMKNVLWNQIKESYKNIPPCKAMTKLSYKYQEYSLEGTQYSRKDEIGIGIFHLEDEFKEILQTR